MTNQEKLSRIQALALGIITEISNMRSDKPVGEYTPELETMKEELGWIADYAEEVEEDFQSI